jgi:hypothetical protein
MNLKKAVKLAESCIQQEIQRLAVDANLYERFGAAFPHAKKASVKRQELREALKVLRSERQGTLFNNVTPANVKQRTVTTIP